MNIFIYLVHHTITEILDDEKPLYAVKTCGHISHATNGQEI
jgi:hypothetical protein